MYVAYINIFKHVFVNCQLSYLHKCVSSAVVQIHDPGEDLSSASILIKQIWAIEMFHFLIWMFSHLKTTKINLSYSYVDYIKLISRTEVMPCYIYSVLRFLNKNGLHRVIEKSVLCGLNASGWRVEELSSLQKECVPKDDFVSTIKTQNTQDKLTKRLLLCDD